MSHIATSFTHLSFGSLELAGLQGKPYFWGVFRGQPGAGSHQSDYHVHVQGIRARKSLSPNSGYHKGFNFEGTPVTFSSKNSPCKSFKKGFYSMLKFTITSQTVHLRLLWHMLSSFISQKVAHSARVEPQ